MNRPVLTVLSPLLLLGFLVPVLPPAPAPPASQPAYTPGQFKLFFDTTLNGKPSRRPYYLSLPESRSLADPRGRLPMVVFLHGICEGGDDHQALFIEAIPLYCRDRADFKQKYPFIFLCPQAPANLFWDGDLVPFVIKLIETVARTHPVDPDRIYLTGLSSGGTGTWNVALARPDLFAAIAPISGRAVTPDLAGPKLARLPVWLNVGGADGDFTRGAAEMAAALRRHGGTVHHKTVPNAGHVIWDEAFLDPGLYAFFLDHPRRPPPPSSQPAGK